MYKEIVYVKEHEGLSEDCQEIRFLFSFAE